MIARDYNPYGKMREPNRRRAKNMNEEEPKGFFELFNKKHVRVKLITNDVLEGVLETTSYNKYDCLLLQEDKRILLPKHAIGFLEEVKEREKQGK